MFDTFINWDMLTVFGTLALAVYMFVEFTKELPIIRDLKTKYYSGIIAFLMIILVAFQSGKLSFIDIPLYILSAIAITFSANGLSDFNNPVNKNQKE